MTRPLRYDDAFINILKEKMHDKFLGIFTLKVQSTAFCQKLNLQKGQLISSLFDITFGVIITVLLFNNYEDKIKNLIFMLETSLCILSIFFGLVGLDAALNLKKANSYIYKNWRIMFTFLYIVLEISNNFMFICFYFKDEKNGLLFNYNKPISCSMWERVLFFAVLVIWSCYITKISWSFYIRLEQSHDLLIIHGKYLEKMLSEENNKFIVNEQNRKYGYPSDNLNSKSGKPKQPQIFTKKLDDTDSENDNQDEKIKNYKHKVQKSFSAGGTSGNPDKDNMNYSKNKTYRPNEKNNEIRLFGKDNQITSGGDIRTSLLRDLNHN
jgi:hypothetical protein